MRAGFLRGAAALTLAVALALLPGVRPQIAFACSCAAPADPVGEAAADPAIAVFAGVAQPPDVGGDVPIVLTRWFKGAPPAAVVLLDRSGFEDPNGGMCGTAAPPPGAEWIFVAGRSERSTFQVGLCTPHGPVAEPHGAQLLGAAIARYGAGTVSPIDPDTEPTAASGLAPELVLGATLGAAALVLGLAAVAAVARRRTRDGEPPAA